MDGSEDASALRREGDVAIAHGRRRCGVARVKMQESKGKSQMARVERQESKGKSRRGSAAGGEESLVAAGSC